MGGWREGKEIMEKFMNLHTYIYQYIDTCMNVDNKNLELVMCCVRFHIQVLR